MANSVLKLTKKLISLRSDPDRPVELSKALKLVSSELQGFKIERFERNGRKSILVHNQKRMPKRFKVILNGHLDVIPGKLHQYTPKIKGDKVFGVGSMDMKANVASMLHVFKQNAKKVSFPLGLQIVTDEEIGGFDGTKFQVDKGVRADFVIAGESTRFDIVNQAKGVLWLRITAKGKTAHGAYPWRGDNALLKMNKFLDRLYREIPVPKKNVWQSSINLSRIETPNQSFNKVPDCCCAWLDLRFVPKDRKMILKWIKRLLPAGLKLEVVANEPALFVAPTNKYLKALKAAARKFKKGEVKLYGAQGTSDARHFTRVGCAGVEFGPVGGGIGTDHEWVSISSLETFQKILSEFLQSVEKIKN